MTAAETMVCLEDADLLAVVRRFLPKTSAHAAAGLLRERRERASLPGLFDNLERAAP